MRLQQAASAKVPMTFSLLRSSRNTRSMTCGADPVTVFHGASEERKQLIYVLGQASHCLGRHIPPCPLPFLGQPHGNVHRRRRKDRLGAGKFLLCESNCPRGGGKGRRGSASDILSDGTPVKKKRRASPGSPGRRPFGWACVAGGLSEVNQAFMSMTSTLSLSTSIRPTPILAAWRM